MELSVSTPRYHYHYPNPKPTTTTTAFSLKPPNSQPSSSSSSNQLRRPKTITAPPKPLPKLPSNPFKNLTNSTHVPTPPTTASLTNKLRLTSRLSPPPPPPPDIESYSDDDEESSSESQAATYDGRRKKPPPRVEFRQEGKIFVGNLPSWVKKHEVAEFFRQFGPIASVILIKGRDSTERNAGFGFVIYGGGPNAAKSAMKAVEFDGVEFHGRVLSVRLDDGGRLKDRAEERARWIEHGGGGDKQLRGKSEWHKERQSSRNALRKVMETEPENWQAVVSTFERINKVEFTCIAHYFM